MTAAVYTLEVIEGADAGRTLQLDGTIEIGREPTIALVLDDPQASRRHARITLDQTGIFIEDLGSVNGTFVNDQPVELRRRLMPRDHLLVGTTVVEIQDGREATQRNSAVRAVPPVTKLGSDTLGPDQPEATPQAPPPALRAAEGDPGYVPSGSQASRAGRDYEAVAALVDGRVKQRTSVAAFGFLSIAALAVIAYFGVA